MGRKHIYGLGFCFVKLVFLQRVLPVLDKQGKRKCLSRLALVLQHRSKLNIDDK